MYIDYASYTGTIGSALVVAKPSQDHAASFKTGPAGPYMLVAIQLRLKKSTSGTGCAPGCTLRVAVYNASITTGAPISVLASQDFPITLDSSERSVAWLALCCLSASQACKPCCTREALRVHIARHSPPHPLQARLGMPN